MDEQKTKAELLAELQELRRQLADRKAPASAAGASIPTAWEAWIHDSHLAIVVIDRDARVQWVSRTEEGVTPQELVGRLLYELIPAAYHDRVRDTVRQVFETGRSACYEAPGLPLRGAVHWYDVHLGPVYQDGHIAAASLIAVDITARKRAERAFRESQRRMTTLLSNLPGMAYRCLSGEGWPMEFVSDGCAHVTGYYAADLMDQTRVRYAELVHPEDQAPVRAAIAKALEQRQQYEVLYRLRGAHGEERWILDCGSGVFADDGRLEAIEGYATDISSQVRIQEELKTHQERLEDLVRARTVAWAEANRHLKEEIEERRKADEALRQREEQYRALVESSPDSVVRCDLQGCVTYVSEHAVAQYGARSPEEMCGRPASDFVAPADHDRLHANIRSLMELGERLHDEYLMVRKDGTFFAAELAAAVLKDPAGPPIGFMAIVRDITDRKAAEAALQQNHTELQAIYNGMVDGLLIVDAETRRLLRANAAFCRQLQYSPADVLQTTIDDLHFPEELPDIRRRFAEHAAGTRTREEELAFRRRDGAAFYADLSSNLITYGNRSCVLAFLRDVTDRRTERAAREKQRQTLRYLLQASEHDRRLLAYEIHDGVSQPLAAALMQLQALQRLLGKSPEQSEQALVDGLQALRQAYAETRRLTAAVQSPILNQSGLEAALADLVHEAAKRSRRKIQFQSQVRFGRLPPVLENALYRITQEAVNNACRHSKSKTIEVRLIQDGSAVCLQVRDWGKGFDPASVRPGAMGLEGIRERVQLLEGTLAIDSQPRQGTTLRVTLPLPEPVVK